MSNCQRSQCVSWDALSTLHSISLIIRFSFVAFSSIAMIRTSAQYAFLKFNVQANREWNYCWWRRHKSLNRWKNLEFSVLRLFLFLESYYVCATAGDLMKNFQGSPEIQNIHRFNNLNISIRNIFFCWSNER